MSIYYKTILRENFSPERVIDTSTYNYGLSRGHLSQQEEAVFCEILKHSNSIGFENMLVLALSACRDHWNLKSQQARARALAHIGKIQTEHFIEIARLASALSKTDDKVIAIRFWEFLYETVRKTYAPTKPIRTESFFACINQETVKKYQQRHGLGELLCRVELMEGTAFVADMTILDNIHPDASYSESVKDIQAYWDGKMSSDPLREVLLQGRIRFLHAEE